jgi:hypothetical protein
VLFVVSVSAAGPKHKRIPRRAPVLLNFSRPSFSSFSGPWGQAKGTRQGSPRR